MRFISSAIALSLAITVFGQVLYHYVAKVSSAVREPWELICGAYFVSFLIVLSSGLLFKKIVLSSVVAPSNLFPAFLIGLAVACVELGYLYAYRSGLSVSIGALSVLAITTVILLPIGVLVFGEPMRLSRVIGVLVTIGGIWLMQANLKF